MISWIRKTYTGVVVDCSNDPGQAESKENIDRVAAGDISDCIVRMLLVHRGGLAGKGVRERGAERYKGDRGHLVLQPDQTAKNARKVSNNDDDHSDEGEGDEEAGVAAQESSRGYEGKDNLEREGEEVHYVVDGCRIVDVPSVHHHRVLHLLSPGLVLNPQLIHVCAGHHHHLVHDRVELVVVGDCDGGLGDLAQFSAVVHLVQLNLKVLVLLCLHVVDNGDVDRSLRLSVLELQFSFTASVVLARDSCLVNCLPFHLQVSICSILPTKMLPSHRFHKYSCVLPENAFNFELERGKIWMRQKI